MKRLCTICARAGSKEIKNKNLKVLAGKPLIAYSLEQAKAAHLFQFIAVSSDSDQILQVAAQWGADFLIKRPASLSTDQAPKIPAIQHCVAKVEEVYGRTFDTVVDLDVTSPLRHSSDIHQAVQLLEKSTSANLITGSPSRRSPYFNLVELNERGFVHLSKTLNKPVVRRQDAPACYDLNASIYVWKRDALLNHSSLFQEDTLLFIMPEERSIDIDSEIDFLFVEFLMKQKQNSKSNL